MIEYSPEMSVLGWALVLGGMFALGIFFVRSYDWGLKHTIRNSWRWLEFKIPGILMLVGLLLVLGGVYVLVDLVLFIITIGVLMFVIGLILI